MTGPYKGLDNYRSYLLARGNELRVRIDRAQKKSGQYFLLPLYRELLDVIERHERELSHDR